MRKDKTLKCLVISMFLVFICAYAITILGAQTYQDNQYLVPKDNACFSA